MTASTSAGVNPSPHTSIGYAQNRRKPPSRSSAFQNSSSRIAAANRPSSHSTPTISPYARTPAGQRARSALSTGRTVASNSSRSGWPSMMKRAIVSCASSTTKRPSCSAVAESAPSASSSAANASRCASVAMTTVPSPADNPSARYRPTLRTRGAGSLPYI